MDEYSDFETPSAATHTLSPLLVWSGIVALSILCILPYSFYLTTSPQDVTVTTTLEIQRGMSVQEITEEAENAGIIRSSFFLYALLTYFYDPTTIYAGTYRFEAPYTVFEVAQKLAHNDIDAELLTITIPEGVTRKDIARIAQQTITDFDIEKFLELSVDSEGYLFPDTYHIRPDFTAEEFITLLTETFRSKIAPYRESIAQSKFTEYEVLIFASLLEREANSEESMRMVAGILQNRMDIGMALQTDASIEYVLNKPLKDLVPEDLKIDSPYNTYLYRGLPPTPIGNAGVQAIEAVLNPTPSDYFYYITDAEGEFHYARTFEEHKRNIALYLR